MVTWLVRSRYCGVANALKLRRRPSFVEQIRILSSTFQDCLLNARERGPCHRNAQNVQSSMLCLQVPVIGKTPLLPPLASGDSMLGTETAIREGTGYAYYKNLRKSIVYFLMGSGKATSTAAFAGGGEEVMGHRGVEVFCLLSTANAQRIVLIFDAFPSISFRSPIEFRIPNMHQDSNWSLY